MLSDFIIAGATMALTNYIKEKFPNVSKTLIPLIVFLIAGLLNLLNAVAFDPEITALQGLNKGLVIGAMCSGIYNMGKKVISDPDNKTKK